MGHVLLIVHVVAAIIFLGDISVTAVWKVRADRAGSARVALFAQQLVAFTDRVLLIPSLIVLLSTGVASAMWAGIAFWAEPAYAAVQLFFFLSGVVWQGVLRPTQARQLALLESLAPDAALPGEYDALARRWLRAGLLAILFAYLSLASMILA